jgi:hypothetical protein
MSWVVDPWNWCERPALRGLFLASYEDYVEDRRRIRYLETGLAPHEVAGRFGVRDATLTPRSWRWELEDGETLEDAALEGVSLVSTTLGARVPLSEVWQLIGKELTREGLAALGYLLPIDAATQANSHPLELAGAAPSVLVDAAEAARLIGIKTPAFRQRVQRGQIPRSAIVLTGRRVQFIRSKLPGVAP